MKYSVSIFVDHGPGMKEEITFYELTRQELDAMINICERQNSTYELMIHEYIQEE